MASKLTNHPALKQRSDSAEHALKQRSDSAEHALMQQKDSAEHALKQRSDSANSAWRGLKISLLTIASLCLALALYIAYVIASVDHEHLPAGYGQVQAKLYLPTQTTRPAALVVGLGGAEGGNAWASKRWQAQRERFLAQGYAFLATAYFAAPGTPKELDRIALEGVRAAIQKALQHPQIRPGCTAIIGGSKGAELALLLGSYYPEIQAVVALAPGNAVFPAITAAMTTSSFAINGQPLPFIPMPWSATWDLATGDLRSVFARMLADQENFARAAIAVERLHGPLLLVSADADELWPSSQMAEAIMQRLAKHQFPHVHAHWTIPGSHESVVSAFPEIETWLQTNYPSQGHCLQSAD